MSVFDIIIVVPASYELTSSHFACVYSTYFGVVVWPVERLMGRHIAIFARGAPTFLAIFMTNGLAHVTAFEMSFGESYAIPSSLVTPAQSSSYVDMIFYIRKRAGSVSQHVERPSVSQSIGLAAIARSRDRSIGRSLAFSIVRSLERLRGSIARSISPSLAPD